MAEELNLTWAKEQPAEVGQNPDNTVVYPPEITKTVPNQCWSVVQAMRFAEMYSAGLRDLDNLGAALEESLSSAVDKADGDASILGDLYAESAERRLALELDPIDEDVYDRQRDPRLLSETVVSILENCGLESELADEDIQEVASDANLEGISDTNVRKTASSGASNAQAERAREIAAKLGLDLAEDAGTHLVMPEPIEIDSTDPYIKKVVG